MNVISCMRSESARGDHFFSQNQDEYQVVQTDSSVVSDNPSDEGNPESSFHITRADEKNMIEKTYLAWRTKNCDLFNTNQQSSDLSEVQCISNTRNTSRKIENPRNHLTVLDRINEISNRLEKGDFVSNSEEMVYNNKNRQNRCENDIKLDGGNETDVNSNMSLIEFERIEALYNKVFSSNKPKLYETEVAKKCDSADKHEYKYSFDNGVNPHYLEESKGKKYPIVRNYSPKKIVSFDEGDVPDMERKVNSYKYVTPIEVTASQCNKKKYKACADNDHAMTVNYAHEDSCENPYNSYPAIRYPGSSYKKECEDFSMPISECIKRNRLDKSSISGRDSFKTFPSSIKQNKSLKYCCSPESTKCECYKCHCSSCHDVSRCKNHINLTSRKISRDSSSESSSEDQIETYSNYAHKAHKTRKKKKITVDELYKIVKLQNEQITLLQKQIDRLLEQNLSNKSDPRVDRVQDPEPCSNMKESQNENCICQQVKSDKFSSQGFRVSVVQENSKIEHRLQNCSEANGNNVKKNSSNVSIGVMTSFVEITQKMQSLTTQHSNTDSNNVPSSGRMHSNKPVNSRSYKQKKRADRNDENAIRRSSCPVVEEESFTLNEGDLPALPAIVNEHIPTPQCSLHLDIQDYGSTTTASTSYESSDCDSDEESDEVNHVENQSDHGQVGWTLYDNVVGQINKILQTGGASQPKQPGDKELPSSEEVRIATLQQLKKLGVSFIDNDTSSNRQVTFEAASTKGNEFIPEDDVYNGPDIKCRTEQMPLQYLNEDQILQAAINIMNKRKDNGPSDNTRANSTPVNVKLVDGNTDLSFATLKYMERYRLLPGSNDKGLNVNDNMQPKRRSSKKQMKKQQQQHASRKEKKQPQHPLQLQYNERRPQNLLSNKILDITALKQQPKLL